LNVAHAVAKPANANTRNFIVLPQFSREACVMPLVLMTLQVLHNQAGFWGQQSWHLTLADMATCVTCCFHRMDPMVRLRNCEQKIDPVERQQQGSDRAVATSLSIRHQ
jgi:hypothetical protein